MFKLPLYGTSGALAGHYELNWSPARAVGSRLVSAKILQPASPSWQEAAQLVEADFNRAYLAQVTLSYPQVIALYVKGNVAEHLAQSKVVLAVAAGYRGAEQGRLFLENYLPQPIENYFDCARHEIVELGSLASQEPGYSDMLFCFIASQMKVQKRKVAVITATTALLNHLKGIGLSPMILGPAERHMLTEAEQHRWGSYYNTTPQVCAFTAADIPLLEKRMRMQYVPVTPQPYLKDEGCYALA